MEEITEEKIQKLLESYKNKRKNEKERYERLKDTEEFKKKNRENARKFYYKNIEQKREYYKENKEYHNAVSSYRYWLKKGMVDKFIEKNPEKFALLKSRNYFNEKNPSPST